jgi:hypothetical protein
LLVFNCTFILAMFEGMFVGMFVLLPMLFKLLLLLIVLLIRLWVRYMGYGLSWEVLLWFISVWLWGRMADTSMFLVSSTCLNFFIYICKSRFLFDSFNTSNVKFLHFLHFISLCRAYSLRIELFLFSCIAVILLLLKLNYNTALLAYYFFDDLCLLCSNDLCWSFF